MERRVERSFEVPAGATLRVDTFYGTVNVREVPGAKTIDIVVIKTADVENEAEMEERLRMLDLRLEASEQGGVGVSADFRRSVTWAWQNWPPLLLELEILVPSRCDLTVRTGDGRIIIGSVSGDVDLTSDTGSIFAKEITGSIKARSRSGAIAIAACTGEIEVSTVTSNITVGRAGGTARLSSRGGYIELQRASGQVILRGDGSDAQVGFVTPIREPADMALSGGNLVLELETNAASTLDLRASRLGRVNLRGDLPMIVRAGGIGKSALQADVNGGGALVQAKVSGGNVWLRPVEPLMAEEP